MLLLCYVCPSYFFFFKQKTVYEWRISYWSSDVCSSDLLGVSSFQAVEAVKLLYIIWLASYLKRYSEEVTATWSAMLKPLGVALLMVVLLILQPDFGSLALILAITGGMLVLGGVNMPRMFGPVLVLLPVLAAVAIAEPYRVRRMTSF